MNKEEQQAFEECKKAIKRLLIEEKWHKWQKSSMDVNMKAIKRKNELYKSIIGW